MNVNIVGPGEEQGAHRDRNYVTALLYLKVPDERPRPGMLVILAGADEIFHRVNAVKEGERVTVAVGYQDKYEPLPAHDATRDEFLYGSRPMGDDDQRVF